MGLTGPYADYFTVVNVDRRALMGWNTGPITVEGRTVEQVLDEIDILFLTNDTASAEIATRSDLAAP
jgi:hypothetical protein